VTCYKENNGKSIMSYGKGVIWINVIKKKSRDCGPVIKTYNQHPKKSILLFFIGLFIL